MNDADDDDDTHLTCHCVFNLYLSLVLYYYSLVYSPLSLSFGNTWNSGVFNDIF